MQKAGQPTEDLRIHMTDSHPSAEVRCNLCGKRFSESEIENHKKEHEIFENFKKGLEKT